MQQHIMMKKHSQSSTFEFATPARPVPTFLQEPSFSQKRHLARTPRDSQPPRPPAKSLPSVSRLFPHKSRTHDELQARNVSFRESESVVQSPLYNKKSTQLYFDQCFSIEQRLGAGSFGEVFKVQSREDGKHYAVKRSRDRFRGEADKRRKLEEVKKHESLSKHPNCVEFYRAWAERGHLYIQTELCEYSLQTYADNHHEIPEKVLRSFMVDLIQGLNHMHSHGLLHLDIKPENVFISFDGVCKLGDFGLSVDISEGEVTDAQEGDPKYLAPELLQGCFGKHADVFSLGITFLELASDLELPQNGDSWQDLRNGRIPWQLTAGISPELKEMIATMLDPDYRKRPTLSALMETSLVQQTIAWQRRRRLVQKMTNKLVSWFSLLLTSLCAVLFKVVSPLKSFHSNRCQGEEPDGEAAKHRHPSEWDLSFSDDEIFENDSSHSSLGCPLGSISFSSEDDSITAPHNKSATNRSMHAPRTPKFKPFRGPTPRSSSPIHTGRPLSRGSPYRSPNVSLVRDAVNAPSLAPTPRSVLRRSPRCTPQRTPRGTPNKLDFSDSESEKSSFLIEPRSLSLEFDQLADNSD